MKTILESIKVAHYFCLNDIRSVMKKRKSCKSREEYGTIIEEVTEEIKVTSYE